MCVKIALHIALLSTMWCNYGFKEKFFRHLFLVFQKWRQYHITPSFLLQKNFTFGHSSGRAYKAIVVCEERPDTDALFFE